MAEQRPTIGVHEYERSPHSGAGNCWCGRARESLVHPHRFVGALIDPERCVCGGGFLHPSHIRQGVP